MEQLVLITVLKDRRDLRLVLKERWYRIPLLRVPKRKFTWLAFYQPAGFGRKGMGIRYAAKVVRRIVVFRRELFPKEPGHPKALSRYFRYSLGPPRELDIPVRNGGPRRVTFAYTTLDKLFRARDILELFEVAPIERILDRAMRRLGLRPAAEYTVTDARKRVRVDLALFCKKGPVGVECDGQTHRTKAQRRRDREKDAFLGRRGWRVLRFEEKEILADPRGCAKRVKREVRRRGGQAPLQ